MLQATKPFFAVLVLVLGVSALGACSSSSKSSTSSPGTTAATANSGPATTSSSAKSVGCGLASADEIEAALGVQAQSPSAEPNGDVTVCLYPGNSNPRNTTIRYETGTSAAAFATEKTQFDSSGQKTTAVSGVGDQAYSSTLGKYNTLVVLKGDTELLITAPASLAKIQALAEQILPKL